MAKQRKLRNAPVTEAVVDIRARLQTGPVDLKRVARFGELVRSEYPISDTQTTTAFEMDTRTGATKTKVDTVGGLFRTADGLYAIQAKAEGFSCSRLRPYVDWDSMVSEARRLWQLYRTVFEPEKVMRISTRFINRIEFPAAGFDFDDYLTIGPRLPEGTPQMLSSFANTVSLPGLAPHTLCIVRCQFDQAWLSNEKVGVVLDLDIIRDCSLSASDDAQIWGQVNSLRSLKNAVFFGSLHEKAVELFE
jgi:uncharacterized protein (TIGR04255 family)